MENGSSQDPFLRLMDGPGIPEFARDRVWHYTNADGLIGVLESNRLWASAPQVLNDSSEVLYGVELVRQELESLIADELIPREIGEYLREATGPEWVDWMQGSVFVASASRESDLLSQWRNYARADGFALGIDVAGQWGTRTVMWDGVPTVHSPVVPGWFNVIYDERSQRTQARNSLLFSAFGAPHRYPSRAADDPGWWERHEVSVRLTLSLTPLVVKHPAFSDEREVRYIGGATDSQVKFRATNGRIVPYTIVGKIESSGPNPTDQLDAPFPLAEVVCGPGCRPGTIEIVQRLMQANGRKAIQVIESAAPFVG